jgi:hypothetical protein
MASDRAMKIAKNTKELTILNRGGSRDKLTQNMDMIGYIWASDNKIDKAPNKITTPSEART